MKKNIVITGENRGIGLALVQQYITNGDAVFAVCRNLSAELVASARVYRQEAIIESLKQNLKPVFLTSFTTIIGFLSINFSDTPPLHDLGNITAVGGLTFICPVSGLRGTHVVGLQTQLRTWCAFRTYHCRGLVGGFHLLTGSAALIRQT